MPKRYSIAEARSNLPSIVDQAASGSAVELTRRGEPVVVVVSLREFERLRSDRPRFGDAYKSLLEKYSPEELGFEPDFVRYIRTKDSGRKVAL